MTRQPILRSKRVTISPNIQWKIEADDSRRYLAIIIDDNADGFDIAFTPPNTLPLWDEWIFNVGVPTSNNRYMFVIDTGCASEVHFRDNETAGSESITVISDVLPIFTVVGPA